MIKERKRTYTQEEVNELKKWFDSYKYDSLRIIDPYFSPADFNIIKAFFDINNNLRVFILTNKGGKKWLEESFL